MQASKGCPYSCAYYCVYGDFQGPKIRARSPKNVVGDMRSLKEQHRIQGFQFRDLVFGLQPGYIEAFCKELKKQKLDVEWGIETRADLLDEQKIKLMFEVGLRNLNLGIETIDPDVAKQNKRLLITEQHQEHIVRYSEKLGVKVCGFYVFALEGDTKETMELTLRYAKKLNTFLARFAVCTPYPGTRLFDDLKKEGRLLTEDYEQYTQFDPVIRHENFDSSDIVDMRAKAYRQYYFRPRYLAKLLKWKIRGFWL